MKLIRLTLIAVLLTLTAVPAFAQNSINSTTLSSAVSPTATSIVLGSVTCTGCTFDRTTVIFIDQELMQVAAGYVSGTTVPVIRPISGTRVAAHVSGATVFLGPPQRFSSIDPPYGSCNKVVQNVNGFYPWFNITTGGEWLCDNGQNAFTAVLWRLILPYAIGTQAASR